MKVFNSRRLVAVMDELSDLAMRYKEKRKLASDGKTSDQLSAPELKEIMDFLRDADKFCEECNWLAAHTKIGLIHTHYKYSSHDTDFSSVCADLRNVADVINAAGWDATLVHVDPKFDEYVNNDSLFGEEVNKAFPSAVDDIRDAGNAIAVDAGTSAVFHLMRAVEWGLRALCRHLGIIRIRKSKKPGKTQYIAYQYADWERMLVEVQEKIDKKINKLRRGKRKQEAQEFYYPLLRDLKGFKDAWRNHVMHTRATYTIKQADDIFDHVKRFMAALATKVSE